MNAKSDDISQWKRKVLPHLDAPEVLIPEINCVVRPWDHEVNVDKVKVCLITPVEYSAAVANMGVAIIYDILNNRYQDAVAERCYYPEPKLRRRLIKDKVPLFSKETNHPLCEFDLITFSSFYPLQMLAIPDMLELAQTSPYTAKRDSDDPIVGLAGVSAFNPAPVWNMVDCVFIGEGEAHVRQLVDILKEEKTFGAGWKLRTIYRWTNEVDGVYVPQFYQEVYFGADDKDHANELKAHETLSDEEILSMFGDDDERGIELFNNVGKSLKIKGTGAKPRKNRGKVPKRIKKAIFAVDSEKPLTNMFVSNSEGQAMSAGSLMIANSCSNKCSFCQGSFISQPYRERSIGVLKEGFSNLIRNTGAVAVTPYCLAAGTLITTEFGKVPIESLEDCVGTKILTREGWRPLKQFHKKITKTTLKITGQLKFQIESSPEHKFWTKEGWKPACNLTEDDSILVSKQQVFPESQVSVSTDEMSAVVDRDWGFILGHLIGDGHLVPQGRRIEFSVAFDEEEREHKLQDLLDKKLDLNRSGQRSQSQARKDNPHVWSRYPKEGYHDGCAVTKVHSVALLALLEEMGIPSYATAHTKTVPDVIFRSTKEVQKEFLSLLMDSDGTVCKVGKGWRIELKTASIELARGVQQLFLNFGMISYLSVEHKDSGKVAVHVNLAGADKVNFANEIGFFTAAKVVKSTQVTGRSGRFIKDEGSEHFWIKVQDIEECFYEDGVELYDLGIEDTHEFVANGLVVHNSFNLSDHSKVNEIVHWLMSDEGRKVSMSSQRIDYFSPDFARAAFLSGNRSITLAIEGGSQRLRDKISKNLTEPMILDAFRTAFEIGFIKIKIYMIANLPEEGDDDRQAIVELATKIREVQLDVQGDRPFTQVRWSWTPFSSKSWTPMQWCKTLDCDPETGLPILEKNLMDTIGGLRDLDYKFRVGTNSDLSIVNQCITHGDRRFSDVLMSIYRSSTLNYSGGMSIGKGPLEEVQTYLRKVGLDYEYFLREKHEDEVFPWDHINTLVTKKFLLDMFHRYKAAQNVAICFDDCTKCGACTPESVKHFNARKSNEIEPDITNVSAALNFKAKAIAEKLRLRFRVDKEFRYVHSSKLKMMLRRAAVRCGLPVKSEIILASDRLKFQNWTAGVDYAEIGLTEKVQDATDLVDHLNRQLELGVPAIGMQPIFPITVDYADIYSSTAGNFRNLYEKVLYSIMIPKKAITTRIVEQTLLEVLGSPDFTIRLKVPGLQRDTWQTVDHECRDSIHDLWAIDRGDRTEIRLLLSDVIGPYELLPSMFKTSKRRLLVYPVFKIDYLMSRGVGAQDMFAGTCLECDKEIELNVLDADISDEYCARHIHLSEQDILSNILVSRTSPVLNTSKEVHLLTERPSLVSV